ncbi:MAG: glycosyltransferase, partial [Planctomycetaceae bacterium]|nr:glycosyltransferase [Planctomycetaceae bacterium]
EQNATRTQLADAARLICRPHGGVTAAWNHAVSQASARWLIFLNNDTVTVGPWIESLLTPLRTSAARMTGVAWRRESHLPTNICSSMNDKFVVGWCFAVERQTLIEIGGFDPSLSVYFSDTDLQMRLQQTPDSLLCVEGLPLLHTGHQTAHRLSNCRQLWRLDHQRFVRKWSRAGTCADQLSASDLSHTK